MYLVHLNNPADSHWGSQPALDRFKVQTEFDIWTLQHASHPSDRKAPAGRGFLGMLKLLFFCLYWSHNNGGDHGASKMEELESYGLLFNAWESYLAFVNTASIPFGVRG